jgi:UDP-N-acetylmuramoyl-L-alanyl-D-glutamate--2,6-diaminopimelate ligase
MNLDVLLKDVACEKVDGSTDIDIKSLSTNSKKAQDGSLFVAVEGFRYKGHSFAKEAFSNGSIAIVTQEDIKVPSNKTLILVENAREVLPILCRNFYQDPSKSLNLIGITGTNGKTTTCYLVDSILRSAGMKTSIITTVESFLGKKRFFFDCTTPESLDLNKFFLESRQSKVDAVCMEVSSHSIDLHRVDYLDFDYFVFTNLSQDHLDYHKNMAGYFKVKNKLFLKKYRNIYGGKKAVINIDDSYGKKVFKSTDLRKISYSIKSARADLWASNVKKSISGIKMNINAPGGKKIKISSPLCGCFNLYNILAAVGVCIDMGIDTSSIKDGVGSMTRVEGRFEKIDTGRGFIAVVDYAHTPDGLENVLRTIKEVIKPGGKLISVFGCGGDRDKGKREIMGSISGKLADFTVITSDNPRTEAPESIINMIEEGFIKSGSNKYIRETDRKKAIFKALDMAARGDAVLIAGKGHEKYQEFENHIKKFSDRKVVKEWADQQK